MSDMVEVTQADRNVAAALFATWEEDDAYAKEMFEFLRSGKGDDHDFVWTIARYRIAATAQLAGELEATQAVSGQRLERIRELEAIDDYRLAENRKLLAARDEAVRALEKLNAGRPSNWDDGDDPDQVAAWQALDAALRTHPEGENADV